MKDFIILELNAALIAVLTLALLSFKYEIRKKLKYRWECPNPDCNIKLSSDFDSPSMQEAKTRHLLQHSGL